MNLVTIFLALVASVSGYQVEQRGGGHDGGHGGGGDYGGHGGGDTTLVTYTTVTTCPVTSTYTEKGT